MNEGLKISTERVDDSPLLLEQMQRLGVAKLLDEHFPRHGHWQGLSLGQVTVGWLSYILSEGDHCLSHVPSWVEQRRELFRACLAPAVRAVDVSDDRLGAVLDELSDEGCWSGFERALTGQTLRVYELAAERVRIDSTSAKGYVAASPEGLFQFGHSQDYRPDLPPVKINVSVLDPLGLPLSTTVVSGNRANVSNKN
jgi:transposase